MFLTVIAALSGSVLLLFCRQTGDQLMLYAAAASLVTALERSVRFAIGPANHACGNTATDRQERTGGTAGVAR